MQKTTSRNHKLEIPWRIDYHICFRRRRSPFRCRLESNCFKNQFVDIVFKDFSEDNIMHQKNKQPFKGKPLEGLRPHCPRTLY